MRLLKERAARHGRSAEAEHREILREALDRPDASSPSMKDLLLAMLSEGEDPDLERPRDLGRGLEP